MALHALREGETFLQTLIQQYGFPFDFPNETVESNLEQYRFKLITLYPEISDILVAHCAKWLKSRIALQFIATPGEFKACCRKHFQFLVDRFGCTILDNDESQDRALGLGRILDVRPLRDQFVFTVQNTYITLTRCSSFFMLTNELPRALARGNRLFSPFLPWALARKTSRG
jgi:hypothetical protein